RPKAPIGKEDHNAITKKGFIALPAADWNVRVKSNIIRPCRPTAKITKNWFSLNTPHIPIGMDNRREVLEVRQMAFRRICTSPGRDNAVFVKAERVRPVLKRYATIAIENAPNTEI